MGQNIACQSREPIREPCSSYAIVSFIYREVNIRNLLRKPDCSQDPAEARANTNDLDRFILVDSEVAQLKAVGARLVPYNSLRSKLP